MPTLHKHIIVAYLFSIPLFIALDAFWIGVVAHSFYQMQIGHLFASQVNWVVAVIFYSIFAIGLSLFAVAPAMKAKNIYYAASFGALFGFFTYMTYDLTNWATLAGWTAIMSYVDIAWGTVASATVAVVSYWFSTSCCKR